MLNVTKHGFTEADDKWRLEAACRDTDPDLFFPTGTIGPAIKQIAAAKEICGRCTVQAACLTYALANREDDGIWGGTTENERRSIIKRQREINSA